MSDSEVPFISENMKDTLAEAMRHTQEAKRQLWAARDHVDRLRTELAIAEEKLKFAEREATESAALTRNFWEFFRGEVEKLPIEELREITKKAKVPS